MPRIRSIKPEVLQHYKVGRLSDRAFRVWVGMLTQADDDGRLIVDVERFRFMFFGYHPRVTSPLVREAIGEIERQGCCRFYSHGGRRYADFPSWKDHQRIHKDHYTPSRLPGWEDASDPPAEDAADPREDDSDPHAGSPEITWPKVASLLDSGMSPVPIRDRNGHGTAGSERIGRDRIGKETTLCAENSARRSAEALIREQAREVLHFLNEQAGRFYRDVDATLKPIEARLRSGASVANCKGVIVRKVREWKDDSKMTKYLRPETLFGASHFESYLGERPGKERAK